MKEIQSNPLQKSAFVGNKMKQKPTNKRYHLI
jgi:hypothetical protein